MTAQRWLGWVRERPLLAADAVAASGFLAWIQRVFSVLVPASAAASLILAADQLHALHGLWLALVSGPLLAASVVLPVYAWSRRGIEVPAAVFSLAVIIGLWTWPFAWQGEVVAGADPVAPWLWPCIAPSTVLLGIARGHVAALVHNLLCCTAYLTILLDPGGGTANTVLAVQGTLGLAIQPIIFLLLLSYVKREATTLDAWVSALRHERAAAAVRSLMDAERDRWEAVLHDDVMAALAAATRSTTSSDPHVVDLASRAVTVLDAEASDLAAEPIPPAHLVRLLRDVAAAVSPGAEVVDAAAPRAPLVPYPVATALAQAVREAVLNVEKHAEADSLVVTVGVEERPEGDVHVRVEVVDDGIGFDTETIPGRRLGIRLALRRRLRGVGGDATVSSAPGEGTRVVLTWTGAGGVAERGSQAAATTWRRHATLAQVDVRPIATLMGLTSALFAVISALQIPSSPRPELIVLATLVSIVVTPLGLQRFGQELSTWRAVAMLGGGVAIIALSLAAAPPPPWPVYATAFIGMVCIITLLMRAGQRRLLAWTLAVLAAITVFTGALAAGQALPRVVGTAINPIGWMVVAEMLAVWLARVGQHLDRAQRAADDAAADNAAALVRLVRREVWVADVRSQVGEVLARLADPTVPITDADRQVSRVLEGRLRDALRAANFSAPSLATAILSARLRGVEVTLVDNREGPLDDAVRGVVTRHLEKVVNAAQQGKIVARTAPQSYAGAVTIMQVDADGATLTTFDDQGNSTVTRT
ncbi:MAG: ATP-binding protein [Propionibacteriaceae bacterium]|nr:ATP-binding protein [Propionibacteriaceae bacterium]